MENVLARSWENRAQLPPPPPPSVRPEASARLALLQQREVMLPEFLEAVQGDAITENMRGDLCRWLHTLTTQFGMGGETYFLSVLLLDRLLSRTRVQEKHLRIIGVVCVLMASKHTLNETAWPEIGELIQFSNHAFSTGDVLRMERLLVEKLGETLVPSCFVFLQELLAALAPRAPLGDGAALEKLLVHASFHYELVSFRGSTQALVVVLYGLRKHGLTALAADLKRMAVGPLATSDQELQDCLQTMQKYIDIMNI